MCERQGEIQEKDKDSLGTHHALGTLPRQLTNMMGGASFLTLRDHQHL